MAVAVDAVGTAQQGALGTSASIPITIGAGANRAVIVHWIGQTDTLGMAANIVGGETLSVIAGTDAGASGSIILGTATTTTGAITVNVTWTTSQVFVTNALSFTGVAQTGSFNGGNFGNGPSPFSTVITSSNGDMTTTTMSTSLTAPATNQTLQWGPITQSGVQNAGDTGPGTGTTTHTWTGTGLSNFFVSGANVVAAAGGVVSPRCLLLLGVGA